MKKTLVVLLFSFLSLSSYANLTEMDATNDEIRDAVIDSFRVRDLNCVDKLNNTKFKASDLQLIGYFNHDYIDYSLKISEDLSQPLITMEKLGFLDLPWFRFVVVVTTDKNFKEVTKLSMKCYTDTSIVRINTGTILKPVFKEEIKGRLFRDVICE